MTCEQKQKDRVDFIVRWVSRGAYLMCGWLFLQVIIGMIDLQREPHSWDIDEPQIITGRGDK